MSYNPKNTNIGILGGGQLGKMLAQAGSRLDFNLSFLDRSRDFPAGRVSSQFVEGDFNNFDDVLSFGKTKEIVSIEIEHVNLSALKELEKLGIKVYPQAAVLEIIKDKGLQKQFLMAKGFPTAPFRMFDNKESLLNLVKMGGLNFPFVQKTREGGYDGKGVEVIRTNQDIPNLLEGPCITETLADIDKELSVIAVRNPSGECLVYPAVSMDFHPTANLVEYLVCPAEIPQPVEEKARNLALRLANELEVVGLLAVELFYNKDGSLWVNEMAPRPHNSGHHTLDNGATSQFLNHLMAISDLKLGATESELSAVMVNILGEPNFTGVAIYEGLEKCIGIPGVHINLYGKNETKPYRKMGHVTITGLDLATCKEKANFVRQTLKVIS